MTRNTVFQLRLSADEKANLQMLAEARGQSVSDFIRSVVGLTKEPLTDPPKGAPTRETPDPRLAAQWICECPTFNRNPSTAAECPNCGMKRPSL